MSLSNNVFYSDEIYKCEKLYTKTVFFDKYFSIVHISLNFVLTDLRFLVAIDDMYIERTLSQNFVLSLSFCLMSKNGPLFIYFVQYFLLDLIENEPGPISKI